MRAASAAAVGFKPDAIVTGAAVFVNRLAEKSAFTMHAPGKRSSVLFGPFALNAIEARRSSSLKGSKSRPRPKGLGPRPRYHGEGEHAAIPELRRRGRVHPL
jgi:hypothetical protein